MQEFYRQYVNDDSVASTFYITQKENAFQNINKP